MKKFLKILFYLLIIIIVSFAVFLIYASIDNYKPEDKIQVFKSKKSTLLNKENDYSLLIWNIGYCGLNKEMDFFYDGGKNVRPPYNRVLENLKGVRSFLKKHQNTDFILLQEVDKNSKRSYSMNEFDSIASLFPERTSSYGKNYDVFFVPTPITEPMGKVEGGLMTISKYKPETSVRYSFPGNYSWPMELFMLDRCFLVNRYTMEEDKELLIINTHNSAYDNGSLKAQQMRYLKDFLKDEYNKGNYIIVAGDWNQCPPNFKPSFTQNIMDNVQRTDISPKYLPKWKWLFDNTLPTNRRVGTPYEKGKTLTTVIDFLLLSPNIESISVKNINLDFEYSDHQPVMATFKLR